ncbi:MAG TPA: FadR/GntR family transcriptional regulator [Candidatus Limnocylindrales bacterium]|nr:FadR/GntR family transcriptional regulator [Candidatus Limnocylindrales bacterium]
MANDEPAVTLRSPTLSERISDALVRRIVRGEIQPGDAMPSEEELATQFDVSRPVVREAVKELTVIGLVESRQGRSTRVAPERDWNDFDPRLIAARIDTGAFDTVLLELLELRRVIESGAAGLAAGRRTSPELAQMEAEIGAMEEMLASVDSFEADDIDHFTDADIRFHGLVLDATRNHLLIRLIELIGPLLRVGRRMSLERRPDGPAESLHGHQAILEAIRSGDAAAARQSMREHLSWTANLRLDELDDDDRGAPLASRRESTPG